MGAEMTLADEAIERMVLGSMLIDFDAVQTAKTKLTARDFFEERHRWIFEAIASVGDCIDLITVGDALKVAGHFNESGGDGYLAQLTTEPPTALNVMAYATTVADYAERRRMVRAIEDVAKQIFDRANPVDVIYGNAMTALSSAATSRITIRKTLSDYAMETLEQFEDALDRKGAIKGISYGIKSLDKVTGGALPARLVVVAGRPGAGKSVLMAQLAAKAGMSGKHAVLYSQEMTPPETIARIAKALAKLSYGVDEEYTLSNENREKFRLAVAEVTQMNLDIRYAASMPQLIAECEIDKRRGKLDIVLLDQLQNMDLEDENKSMTRDGELGKITKQLKDMAMRLNIPVVLGSALNRGAEGIEPTMAHLRDSGKIESDADQVIGLWWRDRIAQPRVVTATLMKNRISASGATDMYFDPGMHRFGDLARDKIAL